MRDLIDGYDYLNTLSSQLPDTIQSNAYNYKQSLLYPSSNTTTHSTAYETDDSNIQLQHIKNELKSISYERMVVDVLTRQTINNTKKMNDKHKNKYATQTQKYRQELRSRGRFGPDQSPNAPLQQPSHYSSSSKPPIKPYLSKKENMNPQAVLTHADAFITIPLFQSSLVTRPLASTGDPPYLLSPPYFRSSSDVAMVPSLRQGSLPVEVAALNISPTEAPPYYPHLAKYVYT